MFDFLFILVFLLVVGIFVYVIVTGIAEWNKKLTRSWQKEVQMNKINWKQKLSSREFWAKASWARTRS